MFWNYRVLVTSYEGFDGDEYRVIEVYYDSPTGNITGWVEDITPYGETLEELSNNIKMILEATTLPTLTVAELREQCASYSIKWHNDKIDRGIETETTVKINRP